MAKHTHVVTISALVVALGCGSPDPATPPATTVLSDNGASSSTGGSSPQSASAPSSPASPSAPTAPSSPSAPQAPGTPTPTPSAAVVDGFGVTMLYPTKAQGETWSLAADPRADRRFDPQLTITPNADGSWKIQSTQVRMDVATSSGYSLNSSSTQDRTVLAARGYMQDPNDWKNVEITGFVKVNAGGADSHITWYVRGGRHSDSVPCEGSAYKGSLTSDGRMRFQKESWHVYYDQDPYASVSSSYMGRWIGFKAIVRNVTLNGVPAVHMEGWLDENADGVTWKKVYSVDDDGSWAGNSTYCGGTDDKMILSWGGPYATFRWDDSSDVDFKWLSVREID